MKHISKLILAAVMATTLAGCALESMAANDLATDRGKAQNEQRAEKHHEKKSSSQAGRGIRNEAQAGFATCSARCARQKHGRTLRQVRNRRITRQMAE